MSKSFSRFQPFVEHVNDLLSFREAETWPRDSHMALNGLAGQQLEKLVPLNNRREIGAFFTNSTLADELLNEAQFDESSIIYDPACGAGDLLLAAARKIGASGNASQTLKSWGKKLQGTDQVEIFLSACSARLKLQAQIFFSEKIPAVSPVALQKTDAFLVPDFFKRASHVIMNPPFVLAASPIKCTWGSGKVNQAAVFVDFALNNMRNGSHIYAILPEVLRTGTRYEKWREQISQLMCSMSVKSVGLFSNTADVDVFFLCGIKGTPLKNNKKWSTVYLNSSGFKKVGELFDVSVGPVVPYRDPHQGPLSRYAHVHNVKPWAIIKKLSGNRQWGGRKEYPPFVVIRRTSRPGDLYRATGSIITGKNPVAVENHLIICRPHDKALESCEALLKVFKEDRTNVFLNKEMRCRHLTVNVVRRIAFES